MIFKELKYYLFWLTVFCSGFTMLNLLYFKTIFFCLIMYEGIIFEFSYEGGLSLLNLELMIFFSIFALQLSVTSSILVFNFIASGLFCFEIKISIEYLWLTICYITFYLIVFYSAIEKSIFYSNINGSSDMILLNLNITNFIINKWRIHAVILLSFILSYLLLIRFYFFIVMITLKKEILLMVIFMITHYILKNFHVGFTISNNFKRQF